MPRSLVVAATLVIALLEARTARAQDPCAEDVKQFCAEVKAGGGRIQTCLKENAAKLSLACSEKMKASETAIRTRVEEFLFACRPDVDRLCSEVKQGGGRILACLSRNQDRLSSSCEAQMERIETARESVSAVRNACRADVERLCSGVSSEAGPLVECLQTNRAGLSESCRFVDLGVLTAAAQLADAVETMTSTDRTREALQIMQGIDTIAFSRSQILLQFDSFHALEDRGNGTRLLFNPQFVFGQRNEFAIQVKAPVSAVFPYAAGSAPQVGLADITTAVAWAFHGSGRLHQYLSLGLRWKTAAEPTIGGIWAVTPAYAVAVGITQWLAFTGQVAWSRSFAENGGPELSFLLVEPVFVVSLPGRSFFVLDTRLGWNLLDGSFVPVMKGVVGMFIDRQKSLSISAWYQHSLSDAAVAQSFEWAVGTGLAYYFDW
jgi:cysteine rich repeat protein